MGSSIVTPSSISLTIISKDEVVACGGGEAAEMVVAVMNVSHEGEGFIRDSCAFGLRTGRVFVLEFWTSAKSKTINNVNGTLLPSTGKSVSISGGINKNKHFSGNITPLFATMLVQPTQDEGASSKRPSEAQPTPSLAPTSEVPIEPQPDSSPAQTSDVPIEHQPNPSPRPSPTTSIPAFILETSVRP
ncbi:hypothetical protein Tco_0328667 [Tanacetum coccineum]